MKTILLTGTAGYIGHRLCHHLKDEEYKVFGVDNLRFNQNIPKEYSSHSNNFIFIKDDISKQDNVKRLIDEVAPDIIINLAALVGEPICRLNPAEAIMVNTEGTRLLLKYSSTNTKFITANTNSQYGTVPDDVLCTEKTETNPISLYAVSKCLAEELIIARGKPYTVLRLGTLYGVSENMRLDLLINNFVYTCVKTGKLEVFEPQFRRNFIHIDDVCRGFIHATQNDINGVFNLGDDKLNTTKELLAKQICEIIGAEYIHNTEGHDPDQRSYNVCSQAFYDTGFEPKAQLNDKLEELVEYCKNLKDISKMRILG